MTTAATLASTTRPYVTRHRSDTDEKPAIEFTIPVATTRPEATSATRLKRVTSPRTNCGLSSGPTNRQPGRPSATSTVRPPTHTLTASRWTAIEGTPITGCQNVRA